MSQVLTGGSWLLSEWGGGYLLVGANFPFHVILPASRAFHFLCPAGYHSHDEHSSIEGVAFAHIAILYGAGGCSLGQTSPFRCILPQLGHFSFFVSSVRITKYKAPYFETGHASSLMWCFLHF